jgi:hypothetical protein
MMRPYLRIGALRLASGMPRISATLQGLPAGIQPFVAVSTMSRTIGELAAGIDLLDAGGTVLRFGYAGQFSGRIDAHAATLKVSMPF